MAVTIGNSVGSHDTAVSSKTLALTNNKTGVLVFVAPSDSTSGDRTVSSVTYGGDNLTKINHSDIGYERVEAWYIASARTGANNIVVTMGGACSNLDLHGMAIGGHLQTIDASKVRTTASDDPVDDSVTTVADNCYVISCAQSTNSEIDSIGGSQTQIQSTNGGWVRSSYSGAHTPAGSVTHEYDTGLSDDAAMMMVSFAPFAEEGDYNHVQGVFGEFKPVDDIALGTLTANQSQGVFGEFKPVIDSAQGAAAPGGAIKDLIGGGFILFPR